MCGKREDQQKLRARPPLLHGHHQIKLIDRSIFQFRKIRDSSCTKSIKVPILHISFEQFKQDDHFPFLSLQLLVFDLTAIRVYFFIFQTFNFESRRAQTVRDVCSRSESEGFYLTEENHNHCAGNM